ncbi:MAG: hypothetical protein ABI813_05180 [Bacteroidota bacterium]
MENEHAIKYLFRHQVDTTKWDQRVEQAANGFIYSLSFYLDRLCVWDALVMGDYDFVMPLPIRKKAGFQYVYTPRFGGQLGIAGSSAVTEKIFNAFINAIPRKIVYFDLLLNEQNTVPPREGLVSVVKTNFIIPLQLPYPTIYDNYSRDAKKNLRQAAARLLFTEPVEPGIVLDMYRQAYGHLADNTEKDYKRFQLIMQDALACGNGFIAGVKNAGGELLASAFFGMDNKRIYYLMGAPTAQGRKDNAVYFLINEIIKKHAGTQRVFDFEGSDIVSVADFYRKFGPQQVSYPHLIINRLPFFLKWLKRTGF